MPPPPRKTLPLRDAIEAFTKDGNIFEGDIGRPASSIVLSWQGTGLILKIGTGTKFPASSSTKIQLIGDKAKIEIGIGCSIKGTLRADRQSRLLIGDHTKINRQSQIRAAEKGTISIGAGCLFSNVTIRNSDLHAIVDLATGARINNSADITLEERVWLGEDVYVYGGAYIGSGSIIGSRSLVKDPIPPNCIAVGTPAKTTRKGVTWHQSLSPAAWKASGLAG